MTITWLGHSCFLLESGGFRVLLDPYHSVPGLPDVSAEADAVYCSHDHFDHNHTQNVRLTAGREDPFTVTEVPSFHDDQGGALRGGNTIRRFQAEGLSVVHLGDLGCALTAEQIAALRPCDALLVPVGGFYTIDAQGAKAAADTLAPRVIVPMHYRSGDKGFDNIETVEPFLALFPQELVRRYDGDRLTLTADTPAQVAVLSV